MERIPKKSKPRASQGDVRLGPENGRGRTQGAKNKGTSAFAVAFMLAAQQVGEDGRGRNGVVDLSRIARTEPKLFFRLYIHVAMDQNLHVAMDQNFSDDEEFQEDVRYETVEEAVEALREQGIELASLLGAAENGQERESRRAATASEKDEALAYPHRAAGGHRRQPKWCTKHLVAPLGVRASRGRRYEIASPHGGRGNIRPATPSNPPALASFPRVRSNHISIL